MRAMLLLDHPSPNFNARKLSDVRWVVVHYTGMKTASSALQRLCDSAAQVSAHYFIDDDGRVFRLVPEEFRAWHAGLAYWRGERDVNSASIGIELSNPGHDWGYRPFPRRQIAALKNLLNGIRARHRIATDGFLGHADIAPSRKVDPGELFPWQDLAKDGFGHWPDASKDPPVPADMSEAFTRLAQIGYAIPTAPAGGGDILNPASATTDVIKAFQRRYMPARIDGQLDARAASRIAAVAAAHADTRPLA